MKKLILFLAVGLFAISANAQMYQDVKAKPVKEAEVAPAAKATFTKLHPGKTATAWQQRANNWEAGFTENGTSQSVVFGPNGQFIASRVAVKTADVPKNIANGKKVDEAVKITDANGQVTWEVIYAGEGAKYDHKDLLVMPK